MFRYRSWSQRWPSLQSGEIDVVIKISGWTQSRDTELNLARAHRYWNDELAGAHPQLARLRRMIFRVPHYQTDRALQEEWEARLAARTLPVMPGAPQVVPPR